jgi:hypothetical protein
MVSGLAAPGAMRALSWDAARDRCIVPRRHAKYAADFFAIVRRAIGRALDATATAVHDGLEHAQYVYVAQKHSLRPFALY